jgi:hypothetical protein
MPFVCHLTFQAPGGDMGDLVQVGAGRPLPCLQPSDTSSRSIICFTHWSRTQLAYPVLLQCLQPLRQVVMLQVSPSLRGVGPSSLSLCSCSVCNPSYMPSHMAAPELLLCTFSCTPAVSATLPTCRHTWQHSSCCSAHSPLLLQCLQPLRHAVTHGRTRAVALHILLYSCSVCNPSDMPSHKAELELLLCTF